MKQLVKTVPVFFLLIILCAGTNKTEPVKPLTAMENYLSNNDKTFLWQIKDTFRLEGVTAYLLRLTSQKWREYTWIHNLAVLVPDTLKNKEALLFISGGKISGNEPVLRDMDKNQISLMVPVVRANKALAAILWQVPNQPLYGNFTEDALISYTLHNYMNDKDFTWPLLFPMTKSAIKAMDAVQEFAKKNLKRSIDGFTVSGFSKRGWTTWLTGANDSRVKAIAPMVIDILNMPVNVDYQVKSWGDYSIEIQDYVKLGIAQKVATTEGREIVQMIDPYSYRKTLTMPKMLFMGTNDQYWPVDAVKNYFDSIPGDNYIHYVPNADHDLGDKKQALQALSAFWENTMRDRKYPRCKWKFDKGNNNLSVIIEASADKLLDVWIWSSDSNDRDFRDNQFIGQSQGVKGTSTISLTIPFPETGYRAAYVDLKYKTVQGKEFTESSRMFVMTREGLTDWTDRKTQ